jgi:glutathionyl-hydroquinone reductase
VDATDRFTVPVLFDKKTQSIVNNESSEIIRIFNTAFNDLLSEDKAAFDIYPEALRKEIDDANEWVYNTVNSKLALLFVLRARILTVCA